MSRWRDVKHGNVEKPKNHEKSDNALTSAPIPARIKAFVVDMFMIMMPIMYVTTYLIMNGKDEFQGSEEARWITALVYGLIIILFWIVKGQTPGLKAYSLILLDAKTHNKISLPKAIIRYLVFLVSATTILLTFIPFFRKDKRTVQDILTNSIVILESK